MRWNAKLYDHDHAFVQQYGSDLIPLLHPKPGELIVDLGCGTGDITAKLAATGARVTGIDYSQEMIGKAKEKYPELTFERMDARNFQLAFPADGLLSNAVLHWIPEKELVIRSMYRNLVDGGRIVLEFGGKGNNQLMLAGFRKVLMRFGLVRNAQIDFWYFPSLSDYAAALEHEGFRVVYGAHFDRPTPLEGEDGIINWFRMFGGNFLEGVDPERREQILIETQEYLRPTNFQDGRWVADYARIRFVAIKE